MLFMRRLCINASLLNGRWKRSSCMYDGGSSLYDAPHPVLSEEWFPPMLCRLGRHDSPNTTRGVIQGKALSPWVAPHRTTVTQPLATCRTRREVPV